MQPPSMIPREAYTAEEITALIRDKPSVEIDAGLELIDRSLNVEEDLSSYLEGGTIQRQSYATLHGSARLDIVRRLDWGRSLVRPYVTLDGVRFNMGAYFTDVSENPLPRNRYSVMGHDILLGLADRVGTAYTVPAESVVLAKVEEILIQQGFTAYTIDQAQGAVITPSARVWALDDNTTWLTVVNDLLASVGYAGIWSDWDGRLRCHPYVSPLDRGNEWIYTADPDTSMLSVDRVVTHDFFDVPNRWIAVRQNNIEGPTPVEGDGIYTYINSSIGVTSVEARGRTITAPLIMVDAADQAALVAAVAARAAADMSVPTTVEVTVPGRGNPLHWHFDRCYTTDTEIGLNDVLVTTWAYSLAPSTAGMTQSWAVLST